MKRHINIVAALNIGHSILVILCCVFIFSLLVFIGNLDFVYHDRLIFLFIAKLIITFLFLLSLPGLIAGIGLLKGKKWAKILTLIISVLELLFFPIGTVIGIYSIWVIMQFDKVEQ